ncbi:MAG TPA: gluconate 2-dehydrogenase subunit 3 family protein [Acidimicrobiia bacterium]|nr:gluconate 2-dehydrogenase subunit 3 family protein [Acidimicrobiia bacterium]
MAGNGSLHFFSPAQYAVVEAACERLIPAVEGHPGARALGVADYVDGLLGAFAVDPPRIFAGGPFSGRFGGDASFADFMALSRLEELAWRTRIEGSRGIPEREFNGPVTGWQQEYRDGIAAVGDDFCALDGAAQDARLDAVPDFKRLLYRHACEGAYSAPEYGGNRDGLAWQAVQYAGDVQPRGYTDEEVSGRE